MTSHLNIKINKKKLKRRYYSTWYFHNTSTLLKRFNNEHVATMQFVSFCSTPYMLCGIEEVKLILKSFLKQKDFSSLIIKSRHDGDIILENEPVLTITGKYSLFCELENIIDSVLARRSSVATNCYHILKHITPSQLVYMSDRSDDYTLHPYDGYSAYVAGVRNFSNYSHIDFINDDTVKVYGSLPHACIQQYHGDINALINDYLKLHDDISLLVDFDNDIIATLSTINETYWSHIKSIRLDTSKTNLDIGLKNSGHKLPADYGVSMNLVKMVRSWLDKHHHQDVKIVCSSDNNLAKVKEFTQNNIPVDIYGIGSALTTLSLHFTADLVELDNQEYAKVGRRRLDWSKLSQW